MIRRNCLYRNWEGFYFKKKKDYEVNMEAHVCNPSTQKLRQEDNRLKACVGYTMNSWPT
jgi:hypothetical protein